MLFLKKIYWWLTDHWHWLRGHIRPLLYRGLPPSYQDDNDGNGHIILIPGLFTRWHFLKDIGDYFALRAWRVHHVASITYNHRALERESRELHEYLEKHGLDDVVIIAHSKGGLIAKYSSSTTIRATHESKKLSLSLPPWSGSHLAKIGTVEAVAELDPHNPTLKLLVGQTASHHKIVSIFPLYDNLVLHENGSYLEGAENIPLDTGGHHTVLFDRSLIEVIEHELAKD